MSQGPIWKVRVDTGGTFTDAWGWSPEGVEVRCKLLSDGRLRLGVEVTSDGRLSLSGIEQQLPDGFLLGWRSSGKTRVIEHVDGHIRLSDWAGGEMLELDSGEEAPVVAARILTGTPIGVPLPEMDFRVATTRGTNALLEKKGARLAFFVTEGFEDLLECRDQRREALFSLEQPTEQSLVARVCKVSGRRSVDGRELVPLDELGLRASAAEAIAGGCRVAAVSLLHAWKTDEDEKRVGEILIEEGFEQVTLSSAVAPVIRMLPRAETAVADAFLAPVMRHFVQRVSDAVKGREVWLMTSAGGLVPAHRYHPKDSLLSGPAGGLIGAAEIGRAAGFSRLVTFDMGGTSTDVARIEGAFSYRQEQQIGRARVVAPALKIETVAAGGGSICRWHEGRLEVGPQSAGSDPGPACYGRGGPLTLTDVNLLLGLMDAGKAGIPLDREASQERFRELKESMRADGEEVSDERELLEGIRAIGVEIMAEAIRSVSVREGIQLEGHGMLAFGGAGPQHACAIAERLGLDRVLVPADAGLLSAWGLERAVRQEQLVRQILETLEESEPRLPGIWEELKSEAAGRLGPGRVDFRRVVDVRLLGQDSVIEIEVTKPSAIKEHFKEAYLRIFGYEPPEDRAIEVVSLRVIAEHSIEAIEGEVFGDLLSEGPQLIQDRFSTCVVPEGWGLRRGSSGTLLLERSGVDSGGEDVRALSAAVRSGLFRSRFEGLLAGMGEALRRTALSTNIKERLDFSCALLDRQGRLVASAPHVPVHLGALGVCVRETVARLKLEPGEVAITNHPAAGGSHLPDVTLIAPVHDSAGRVVGYVANRAHHAEIGGKAPGSMPADATSLAEEGVVIAPRHLVKNGSPCWDDLNSLLREGEYPSRRPSDNLADVEAQLAACHMGREALGQMVSLHGSELVALELEGIMASSAALMERRLMGNRRQMRVAGALDDGTALVVEVQILDGEMRIDFEGSGGVHPRNLNATPAIVRSVVLYVLRLWLDEDVPLNEGLLEAVEIRIPRGLLNPDFDVAPMKVPAVVGGNVETSQRLVDLLLEAFGLAANGPGTMNNFLFGDDGFGYYETLAGGSGAGPGFDGAGGRQVHMTNTALTDPEVLEHRYPVRVWSHGLRRGSGGMGEFRGGDGIVRELEFLKPLTVSFLTQRRRHGPRGLEGAERGQPGSQRRLHPSGSEEILSGACTYRAVTGERVRIETPGGGGWGIRKESKGRQLG